MAFQWFRLKSAILVLILFTTIVSSFIDASRRHSKRASSSNHHQEHECTDCATNKQKQEKAIPHEKMISIRTELIKNQILRKLRLSKPPEITNATPIMLKEFLHTDHPSMEEIQAAIDERKSKEFYGKIVSVAVLPETIQIPSNKSTYPSALMYFRLTPKIVLNNVISAELWFRNGKNSSARVVVSEINNDPNAEYPKKLIALNKLMKPLSWHKVEIGAKVNGWLSRQNELHEIEISCRNCDKNNSPIDIGDNKPVLVIRTNSTSSRLPRSTCNDSNSNGCCVQELYINFTDIGWSDWIVQPSGYMANYCRGTCINEIDRYRNYHSNVVREFIKRMGSVASDLRLGLCCTPSKMSSISIIYKERENLLYEKHLPNMVVEECDCA